jgi:hypothetical protein
MSFLRTFLQKTVTLFPLVALQRNGNWHIKTAARARQLFL